MIIEQLMLVVCCVHYEDVYRDRIKKQRREMYQVIEVKDPFGVFDEARILARLLEFLESKGGRGVTVTDTYEAMLGGYGVGRTAVDSSLEAGISLKLVEQAR